VGYVYAFRHGRDDEFKFGRTTNLERRRKGLQTGCPRPLTVFDFIETDEALAGERFILRRLASKQLIGEIFAVTPDEASAAMQACREFLENELPSCISQSSTRRDSGLSTRMSTLLIRRLSGSVNSV
jgi:hypothetical protein